MNIGAVLNRVLNLVEDLAGFLAGDRRHDLLSTLEVRLAGRFLKLRTHFSTVIMLAGIKSPQHFAAGSTKLMNPFGIAIQNFQHWQRLRSLGNSAAISNAGVNAMNVWKPT